MSNIKRNAVFKLVCVAAISGMLLTGCTEDSGLSNNPDPTVEYKENVAGDNNLAKYTSADWLYQNYFGEYGLPDELKIEMMPILMMLANGFALQHSRGENVEASISELHTAMQMLYHSGELGSNVQSMLAAHDAGAYDTTKNEIITEAQMEEILLNNPLVLSEEAQRNVDEAERLDEIFLSEQEQLVKDHNLPYALPDQAVKYFIYSHAQWWNKRRSGGGKNNNNNNQPAKPKHKNIDSWAWGNADIIWSNALAGIGHVGMVSVGDERKVIVDANKGGVKAHRQGLDRWANDGGWSRIEGWRYQAWGWFINPNDFWHKDYKAQQRWNWGLNLEEFRRGHAKNYAFDKVGTPYSIWIFDKERTDATYCSLLVWKAYDFVGLNIDRDGGSIVWPNDIRRHRFTARFNTSQI